MSEWHLYANVNDRTTLLRFPSWEVIRGRIGVLVDQLSGPERPMMQQLIRDATPDRPWHCASEHAVFKLREIKEHPPVSDEPQVIDGETFTPPDDADGAHADLGASSAYRWWECPGSLNLTKTIRDAGIPPKPSSIYALRGTLEHQIVHHCLITGMDAIEWLGRMGRVVDHETGEILHEEEVDDDIATAVQVMLDRCRRHMHPGTVQFSERKFSLKGLNAPAPMFGTCDFLLYDAAAEKVVVIDYKGGAGVKVKTAQNPQLKYYAMGGMLTLTEGKIKTIETEIVQPRAVGKAEEPYTYRFGELLRWQAELMEHARATLEPDAPRKAGSWCRFCPASGHCTTEAAHAYEVAQLEFADTMSPVEEIKAKIPNPHMMSPEQLGNIFIHFGEVRNFMHAVTEAISNYMGQGVHVPYVERTQGLGHRRWKGTTEEIKKFLMEDVGLTEDQCYTERTPIKPPEAEKHIYQSLRTMKLPAKRAGAMAKEMLKEVTFRPPTAPVITVIGTSSRPALLGAQDEFEADPDMMVDTVTQST